MDLGENPGGWKRPVIVLGGGGRVKCGDGFSGRWGAQSTEGERLEPRGETVAAPSPAQWGFGKEKAGRLGGGHLMSG